MIKFKFYSLSIILFFLVLLSCSSVNVQENNNTNYISLFDELNFSTMINKRFNTIVKVNSYNMYTQYNFRRSDNIDSTRVNDNLSKADTNTIQRNSAGTALVLKSDRNGILLLTALHIVDYPEEKFVYYNSEDNINYVNAYMKRRSHRYNVIVDDKMISVDPIIKSKEKDLVLLEGSPNKDISNINYLDVTIGRSNNLKYSDLIYILGYPKGKKMITHGIISSNQDKRFIVDAPFNKGMSGGIVFAINKGASTMEMVGMATSAAADYNYLLTPGEDIQNFKDFNEVTPYDGKIYIDRKPTMNYGITFVRNVDNIINFFENNKERLEYRGYDIDQILRNYYRDQG